MFEDIIVQLDEIGVQYTEDYDMGTLTIDVGALDKVALIQVIQTANDSGMEFTIDDTSLVIMAGAPVEEEPEMLEEEPNMEDMQGAAMEDMFR